MGRKAVRPSQAERTEPERISDSSKDHTLLVVELMASLGLLTQGLVEESPAALEVDILNLYPQDNCPGPIMWVSRSDQTSLCLTCSLGGLCSADRGSRRGRV